MWALQAYLYWESGAIYSRLTVGGLAVFLIGAATWFYYLDDKLPDTPARPDKALPAAEVFEQRFGEVEPVDERERRT
jgi:hypothetical protein